MNVFYKNNLSKNPFFHLLLFAILTGLQTSTLAQTLVADVNINTQRSIEGVSEFDRDVFINMHSMHTVNSWETYELNEVVDNIGINLGRSVGGVAWQYNRVDEDPDKPGYFDLSHMQTLGQDSKNWYSSQTSLHQYAPESWVMASQIAIYPDGTPTNQGWIPANYEAVGQFYAHLIKDYYGGIGGARPNYVEVINEPIVHAGQLNTTNENISEFHNVVADSIRFHNPDVQVGGFTAAWPAFERNNFGVWNSTWKTFIDIAGENMDFFSFHIYDTPIAGDEVQRKGSNTEAIFDMVEQYSFLQLGEVKPMVISEYGACCADWDGAYFPERDWTQLKAFSSMTMSMMERPNKILKAIPFVVSKATWYLNNNPFPYPHVLLENTNGGFEWEYTHLRKYYELWSNVEGTRVDTWSHDPDLQIDAFVKENKAYVVLNNLEHAERTIELNLFENEGNQLQEILIKHLYADGGVPQLDETVETTMPASLTIGREAAIVLEYTFTDNILLNQSQEETKYYADTYLQAINSNTPRTFNINGVTTNNFGEAVIRLGVGRSHGKSLHPTVTLNGTTVNVPTDWKGYDQSNRNDFFGVIEIPVDYDLLGNNNVITVEFGDSGGHISSVTMQVKNFDYDPTRTTVSVNNPLPVWAEDLELFPNPAAYQIQLKGLKTTDEVYYSIFSMEGKQVLNGILPTDDSAIDIEKLPQGMYHLHLQAEGGIVVEKMIKM